MFKCGVCNRQSKPGEKATRVVIQTRFVKYPFRPRAFIYKDILGHEQMRDDKGGEGIETVKEVLAHIHCAEKFAIGASV